MKFLTKPKNQWSTVLWIINQRFTVGTSMADVLRNFEPFFYKFQSRLGEIEKEYPTLNLERKTLTHKSKLTGKVTHYTHYTPKCSQSFIYQLYNDINDNGFKGKTNKPEPL